MNLIIVVIMSAAMAAVVLAQIQVHADFVTYNVQSFPNWIQSRVYLPNQGRVEYIPDYVMKTAEDKIGHRPDIICFEEAFSDDIRQQVIEFSNVNGYYHTGPVSSKLTKLQLINGGVMLLSKTPVTYISHHEFSIKKTCGLDRFARKGWIYAETVIDQVTIGIVATHLQAVDNMCATYSISAEEVAAVKQRQQLKAIRDFLHADVYGTRQVDAVFLIGDLNLNSYDGRMIDLSRIRPDLDIIEAMNPINAGSIANTEPGSPVSSFDPTNNSYIQTLVKESKSATPATEHDDYVLALGWLPADVQVTNEIVPIRRAGYGDLSDHHSVFGHAVITRPQ